MRFAGAILVAVVLGVAAAPAWAGSDPGWYEGHSAEERQALVDYAFDRTEQATVPYTGEAATLGESLSDDVAAVGSDELPLAPEVGGAEFSAFESAGLMADVAALAPELVLTGGLLAAGVAIDVGVHTLFAKLAAPADARGGDPTWTWERLAWRSYGEELWVGGDVQQSPGAYIYYSGTNPILWDEPPCPYTGFTPPPGARLQTGVPTAGSCRVWVEGVGWELFPDVIDYPYLLASDVSAVAPLRPWHSETDSTNYFRTAPPAPRAEVVEEGLSKLDADGSEDLREELDWALTPGAQEKEEPASDGTRITTDDRACKAFFEEAPALDPGDRSPEAAPEAADWDFDVDDFSSVYNPLTRTTQTVKLRWGTRDWGYRHIVLRHGWNRAAGERTALALQDPAPQVDRDPSSFVYRADLEGGPRGLRCRQLAVVSYREDGTVPVGRHIITSFIEAD